MPVTYTTDEIIVEGSQQSFGVPNGPGMRSWVRIHEPEQALDEFLTLCRRSIRLKEPGESSAEFIKNHKKRISVHYPTPDIFVPTEDKTMFAEFLQNGHIGIEDHKSIGGVTMVSQPVSVTWTNTDPGELTWVSAETVCAEFRRDGDMSIEDQQSFVQDRDFRVEVRSTEPVRWVSTDAVLHLENGSIR